MSEQSLIDAAKAPVVAYNSKDWAAVRAAVAPGFKYEEFGTQRKFDTADETLTAWRAWASALPDSKATFDKTFVSGNTVIFEVTWRGTHSGPLQMPTGSIPATGNKIELPACQVIEVSDGKARTMRQYFDLSTLLQQLGAPV